MGLFSKKKKQETPKEEVKGLDEALRDDISKAYDELISGKPDGGEESVTETADAESAKEEAPKSAAQSGSLQTELLKAKIKVCKEKKTNETLLDVFNSVRGMKFLIPSISNMKEPFEKSGNELKLKKGAVLNPALLASQDKKTFLPIFTDNEAMTQKSPSGIVLQFTFEQCVGIVYNKQNPVSAIVINPFTENFIISEELLRAVFREVEKK